MEPIAISNASLTIPPPSCPRMTGNEPLNSYQHRCDDQGSICLPRNPCHCEYTRPYDKYLNTYTQKTDIDTSCQFLITHQCARFECELRELVVERLRSLRP